MLKAIKDFWAGVLKFLVGNAYNQLRGRSFLVTVAHINDFATRCAPGGQKYSYGTENSLLLTVTGFAVNFYKPHMK
jgi:hypothetical protein